jgi:[ribosomal protein S5]-alanine N-acetyltransferase
VSYNKKDIAMFPYTAEMAADCAWWFESTEICKYNSHAKLMRPAPSFESIDVEKQIIFAFWAQSMHVGNAMLEIDWINRSAEFSCIFGCTPEWGKGIGTIATTAMLDHGFKRLNLHRIWLGTPVGNTAMMKIATKLGMSGEGLLKDGMFIDGNYMDVIRFGILQNQWIQDDADTAVDQNSSGMCLDKSRLSKANPV